MNKQGKWYVAAIIIISILIIIGGIIFLTIILSNKTEEKQENIDLKLYLKTIDSENNRQKVSQYSIVNKNNNLLSKGISSSDSLTEIEINQNPIQIYCYSPDYYLNITNKKFSDNELNTNSSRVTCGVKKISDIELSHEGKIEDGEEIITIKARGENFKYLSGVYSWTRNIKSVIPIKSSIKCANNWTNFSYQYREDSKDKFIWLPENHYSCNGQIQKCSSIDSTGKKCELSEEVPERFSKGYSHAFASGLNANETGTEINFKVKASNPDEQDCITFIFYDKDLRYNNGPELSSELNQENIGNDKDFPYKICYSSN